MQFIFLKKSILRPKTVAGHIKVLGGPHVEQACFKEVILEENNVYLIAKRTFDFSSFALMRYQSMIIQRLKTLLNILVCLESAGFHSDSELAKQR